MKGLTVIHNVTVTLSPDQAAKLVKFCESETKKANRRIDRLNSAINAVYNELYTLSDLAASVRNANADRWDDATVDAGYNYGD